MTWQILFNDAFLKLEGLAKGGQDDERLPEGALTFGELRSIVAAVRKMGVDKNAAERKLLAAEDLLDAIAGVLERRGDEGV